MRVVTTSTSLQPRKPQFACARPVLSRARAPDGPARLQLELELGHVVFEAVGLQPHRVVSPLAIRKRPPERLRTSAQLVATSSDLGNLRSCEVRAPACILLATR
eukprot:6214074-Pleurochrysis_carterae.AAC.3